MRRVALHHYYLFPKKHCYMFDPHGRNSCGLPINGGTSILASFKSRQNMISHIRIINSVSEDSRQNPMDLYSMCVVSFNQVNIQMQSYFIDQKYQYLKSKPLAKDAEEEKTFEYEKYQMNNKKGLRKQDIAKHKNTQKWKIAAEKRKSIYSQSEKSQTKLQKMAKKETIKSLHRNEIFKNKLSCNRGKDNVNTEKIFKRYVYLRKIANL